MTEECIKELIEFCYEKKLIIYADEVYQFNIYQNQKDFVSVKKVLENMPAPYNKT